MIISAFGKSSPETKAAFLFAGFAEQTTKTGKTILMA